MKPESIRMTVKNCTSDFHPIPYARDRSVHVLRTLSTRAEHVVLDYLCLALVADIQEFKDMLVVDVERT